MNKMFLRKVKSRIFHGEKLYDWSISVTPTEKTFTIQYLELIGRMAQRTFEKHGFGVLPDSDHLNTWIFRVYHENPAALTKFLLEQNFKSFRVKIHE